MGMTIDEAIKVIKEPIDTYIVCHGEEDTVAVSIDNVDVEALDLAIDTMRKYQKIEQIISEWTTNMNVNTTMAMCEIEEVVKDGKID